MDRIGRCYFLEDRTIKLIVIQVAVTININGFKMQNTMAISALLQYFRINCLVSVK